MKGVRYLQLYFQGKNEQFIEVLNLKHCLTTILQNSSSLVIYIKHLENIYKMDVKSILKTLILTAKLVDLEPKRIKQIMPFKNIHLKYFNLNEDSLEYMISQKLTTYINQRLNNQVQNLQKELQILMNNLYQFLWKKQLQKSSYTIQSQYFYGYVQQKLLNVRLQIERDFNKIEILQADQFLEFYGKYTIFCEYRRKMPKIINKNLKYLKITKEMNDRILKIKNQIQLDNQQAQSVDKQNCQIALNSYISLKEDEQSNNFISIPARQSILSPFDIDSEDEQEVE